VAAAISAGGEIGGADNPSGHRGTRETRVISHLTAAMGSSWAIAGSVVLILVWAATGPFAGFSATWQLIINTTTTILTFNMVFVIQNTQNRDGLAVQVKLDAILHSLEGVDDQLMGIEDLPAPRIAEHQAQVRAMAEVGLTEPDRADA
jgi:low affinity Fe/Cu permease